MSNSYRFISALLWFIGSTVLLSCGGGGISIDANITPFPGIPNTDFEAEEEFSFSEAVGSRTLLRLETINSNISLTGTDAIDSVTVSGVKRVGSFSQLDAEQHLADLVVEHQALATEIIIRTIQPKDSGGRKYEVDYIISLPKEMHIAITNANGPIRIEAINNSVSVNSANGSVNLIDILGSAFVVLANGYIGSDVTVPLNGTVDFRIINGNIDLSVPVNTSAGLSAVVNNGVINVSNLTIQNEMRTATTLSGTLGTGQGAIVLESAQNGNINIVGVN